MGLIVLENVSLQYVKDQYVLHDVNLQFLDGHVYEIVGDDLSSSSMLIRVIGGLEKITNGHIFLDQKNIDEIPIKDRGIGYLSKDLNFLRHSSVFRNLYYVLKIRNISKTMAMEQINRSLQSMNWLELKNKKIKDLSRFQQIKLAILRMNLVERNIILIEDIWEGLTNNEVQECLSMIKPPKHLLIMATHQKLLPNSNVIDFKWGCVNECRSSRKN